MNRVDSLITEWANLTGSLGLAAEMGDRVAWEETRSQMEATEQEIEALGGGRPPYATGWGPLAAEVGFDPIL